MSAVFPSLKVGGPLTSVFREHDLYRVASDRLTRRQDVLPLPTSRLEAGTPFDICERCLNTETSLRPL